MQKNIVYNLDLKIMLLFIPAAFLTYFFHEFGHWITGEILGNDMAYSLNGVWPKNGTYLVAQHGLSVEIGGPAFSILQSLIFMLIIERNKSVYAYPFVFFPLYFRLFSLIFTGFSAQDEARISATLDTGTYTIAILVLLLLFLVVWRASFKLNYGFKHNSFFVVISTICLLIVEATNGVIK
jgi:hypothetical protein